MTNVTRATHSRARALALSGAFLLIAAFAPTALSQPAPLKNARVPGWPELRVRTHYVSPLALRGYCLPVPAGTPIPDMLLDSCARPDFWNRVCDVFIDARYKGIDSPLREHEEKRCRGYDYRGSNFLAEALRAWRERGENRHADMLDFESFIFAHEPPGACGKRAGACVEIR